MEILFGIFLAAGLIYGPNFLYARFQERRQRREAEGLEDRLENLNARFDTLQKQVRELQSRTIAPPSTEPEKPTTAARSATVTRAPTEVSKAPAAPGPPPIPMKPTSPLPVPGEVTPVPSAPPVPSATTIAAAPPAPPKPPTVATPPPRPLVPPPTVLEKSPAPVAAYRQSVSSPAAPREKKFTFSMEEMIGTNWLPKLGVGIMFIGLVTWIASQWEHIPPNGRIGLFYLWGGAMLGVGIRFEKRDNFLTLGRSLIGGGWAVLFFTTYAMHHVAAARILDSLEVDLALMLAVAAVMVWHTLKYDSQVVTGMAFFLGFFSITQSHASVYSLFAGVILAAGLAVIVLRRQWYELEIFGILASFLTHLMWLYPIIEPMKLQYGKAVMFDAYPASVAVLFAYWVIFRVSYVVRRIEEDADESLSTVAALTSSFLLMGILKYQSVRPELAFYALLGIGIVELALGQVPLVKRRRKAFLVLSTLGSCLFIGAFPFKYTDSSLAIFWLLAAQAFLFAGIFNKEPLFRRVGLFTAMLVTGYELVIYAFPAFGRMLDEWHVARTVDAGRSLLFVMTGTVMYFNSLWVRRRWQGLFADEFDTATIRALSYLGTASLLAGTYLYVPQSWVATTLAALGLGMIVLGRKFDSADLHYQAHGLAAIAFLDVIASNADITTWVRSASFIGVATLLYVSAWLVRVAPSESHLEGETVSQAYTWGGIALLVGLIAQEAPDLWVAVAWTGLALVVAALARRIRMRSLLWQAHVLALLATARVLAVNFDEAFRGTMPQLFTVAAVAGGLYALSQLTKVEALLESPHIPHAYPWAASLLVTWLMWYQLTPISVALGWALFGALVFEIGVARSSAYLRWQGYFALAASFIRIFFVNLNAEAIPGRLSPQVYTVLPLAILYFYVYWRATAGEEDEAGPAGRLHLPTLLSFFGSLAVAALMRTELPLPWVATGWSILALALLGVALMTWRKAFLIQGLIALGAASFRLATYNLDPLNEGRLVTTTVAAFVLLAGLPLAYRLRTREDGDAWSAVLRRPEQAFFFLPLAIFTLMLGMEFRGGAATLSWGLEGLVIFVLAMFAKERSFRLAGLALLLGCVVKILGWDVWRLSDTGMKAIALIAVGAILTVVAFLYGKYKEALREYL